MSRKLTVNSNAVGIEEDVIEVVEGVIGKLDEGDSEINDNGSVDLVSFCVEEVEDFNVPESEVISVEVEDLVLLDRLFRDGREFHCLEEVVR